MLRKTYTVICMLIMIINQTSPEMFIASGNVSEENSTNTDRTMNEAVF